MKEYSNIDYEHIAKMIAKKAIEGLYLSASISEVEQDILFRELDKIANNISPCEITDEDNWFPFRSNIIDTD